MALGCLELLKKLKQNPCDLPAFAMNRDVDNVPELLEEVVTIGPCTFGLLQPPTIMLFG